MKWKKNISCDDNATFLSIYLVVSFEKCNFAA